MVPGVRAMPRQQWAAQRACPRGEVLDDNLARGNSLDANERLSEEQNWGLCLNL